MMRILQQKPRYQLILAAVVALLALLFIAYAVVINVGSKKLNITQAQFFILPAGSTSVSVANQLERDGIMAKSSRYTWLLRLQPSLAQFKAGTYRITPEMTLKQFLTTLCSGIEAQSQARFVEGSRFNDWLKILETAPDLEHQLAGKSMESIEKIIGIEEAHSLEGWLYPDTYSYTINTNDVALLQRAYLRMKENVLPIWQGRDQGLPYKNIQEMVIMASIIEKETAVPQERTRVASVFINRLEKGMRLQTDPTVIYGMGNKYNGAITRKDLTTKTAYNTYTNSGLPPTPIAMPGLASLKAAAHPDKTPYLYFVADGSGGHKFSTDLDSHNKAVKAYWAGMKEKNEQ